MNCADAEVLGAELRKFPLRALHMNGNRLEAQGAVSLARALAGCADLHTLDLSFNKLADEGAEALAVALRRCPQLTSLSLSHINVGRRGLEALGGVLPHCGALLHLTLRGNTQRVNDSGGEMHVVHASGRGAHITHLDLAVSIRAFAMFEQVVCLHASTLVYLDLQRASMRFSSARALAKALEGCGVLEHLNLAQNDQLDDDGVLALAVGLAHCTSLSNLNLRQCNVQPGGCSALAEGLKQCTALTTLNLQDNKIGPGGALALAMALPYYFALANRKLSFNRVRVSSATTIANMIGRCPAFFHLHLEGCNVYASGERRLLAAADACDNLVLHL